MYTVFFKEANRIFAAKQFIDGQSIAHQAILNKIVDELTTHCTTTSPKAHKNSKGEWTIVISDNEDVYVYTVFISKLEMQENSGDTKTGDPQKKDTLVIIDPSGPRDSLGGYHPGYWLVDQYSNFLKENLKPLFAQTVHQIMHNIPSDTYSISHDGSISIHIERKDKTSVVSLTCRAEWI